MIMLVKIEQYLCFEIMTFGLEISWQCERRTQRNMWERISISGRELKVTKWTLLRVVCS